MKSLLPRDWIALLLTIVVAALAIAISPAYLGALIFPAVIWLSVWAQRGKAK